MTIVCTIKLYGLVPYGLHGNLVCLSKQAQVTDNIKTAPAYSEIFLFSVYYESVVFYRTGP
jgi:hypothetical protein